MDHFGDWGFMGMHFFWWLFLLIAGAAFVVFMFSSSGWQRRRRETPLERLQRRFADGELSEKEYEERKAILERDRI